MHLNKKYLGILVLARFQRKPIFRIKVYRRIILQCNGSWTPYIGGLLPHLIKTIIFHRNGSWKYTVISRVKSSEISFFLCDLASTRMQALVQSPYVAARAGVEPTTLRLKVIDSINEPLHPTYLLFVN